MKRTALPPVLAAFLFFSAVLPPCVKAEPPASLPMAPVQIEIPAKSNKMKLWAFSAAMLTAAAAVDIHSSYGRPETNPFLRGQNGNFSAQSVALKSAIVGGAIGIQWLILRKRPSAAGWASTINFAAAGATGAAAAHNYSTR